MFGNFEIADLIAYHCSYIDVLCRQELNRGILVSERDYVTSLSTRIRDRMQKSLNISCHAQTVSSQIETKYGVDAIIVFKFKEKIKVGLYEAKRPQIYDPLKPGTINNYKWDILTSRGTSHFSEQIEKQNKWFGILAVWAMFFNNGPIGFASPPFDYFGSSCVWHENTFKFMNTQGLIFDYWKNSDLKMLMSSSCVNFYSIIYDIISCKVGKQFEIDKDRQSAIIRSPFSDNIFMEIPLPIGNYEDERIESFLLENNLDNFTFLNLDNTYSV